MIKGYLVKADSKDPVSVINPTDGEKLWSTVHDCEREESLFKQCFVNGVCAFVVVVVPEDRKEYYECYSLGSDDINPNLSKYFDDSFGIVGDCRVYLARPANNKYEPVLFDWTLDWFAANFEQCVSGFAEKETSLSEEESDDDDEDASTAEIMNHDEKKARIMPNAETESKQPMLPLPITEVHRVIQEFLDSDQVMIYLYEDLCFFVSFDFSCRCARYISAFSIKKMRILKAIKDVNYSSKKK